MPVPRVARLLLLPLAAAASLATTMQGHPIESPVPPGPGRSSGWGRAELVLDPLAAPASFAATVFIELDPPSELVYDRTVVVEVTALGAGARAADVLCTDAYGRVLIDTTIDAAASSTTYTRDDELDAAMLEGEPWVTELPLQVEVTEGTVELRVRATVLLDAEREESGDEAFSIPVTIVPAAADTGG